MKLMLILNGKKAGIPEIRQGVAMLRKAGYEVQVRVTWESSDIPRFIAEARDGPTERIIAGGGDGTINEVASSLMQLKEAKRLPMAVLPLGTANDFASACNMPTSIEGALRLAVRGYPRAIDIVSAGDRYFINVASAGFGASVTAETPTELKNFLGGGAYTLMGVLKAFRFKPYEGEIRTPDFEGQVHLVIGAFCNGRQAGGGQVLGPSAMLDDGLLDVLYIKAVPINALDQVRAELTTPGPEGEYVSYIQTPWVEFSGKQPIPLNLDGEPVITNHLKMTVIPGAIQMVLPADCPCVSL